MIRDGENLCKKQRPLNTIPAEELNRCSSLVLLKPGEDEDLIPLFSRPSLKLLEFVEEFSTFHCNLLCSVFSLAVTFPVTERPS